MQLLLIMFIVTHVPCQVVTLVKYSFGDVKPNWRFDVLIVGTGFERSPAQDPKANIMAEVQRKTLMRLVHYCESNPEDIAVRSP